MKNISKINQPKKIKESLLQKKFRLFMIRSKKRDVEFAKNKKNIEQLLKESKSIREASRRKCFDILIDSSPRSS